MILGPNSFSDERNDAAGRKCLSPAEGGNIRDSFSLFHSRFPWSPRDTWREPQGGRESAALGWSCAAELGWAPGTEGAHGKRDALQRDSSAQEQGWGHCLQALRGDV